MDWGSLNQPSGEPAGLSRTYSEVSAYSVNAATMTAQNVWNFNYGQSIYSSVCGSGYEAPGNTYLVDFATADNGAEARLVGLDPNQNVVFDFQYASPSPCDAAWNAIPNTDGKPANCALILFSHLDNHFDFTEDKTEWKSTEITFESIQIKWIHD
jgi:hypothetical protein